MTTSEIIARYSWTPAEITTLETLGIDRIDEIFAAMDDTTFDKVTDYFTGWILRENPKARFNYWAKKAGVTEEMVNIYLTVWEKEPNGSFSFFELQLEASNQS